MLVEDKQGRVRAREREAKYLAAILVCGSVTSGTPAQRISAAVPWALYTGESRNRSAKLLTTK